MWLCTKMWQLRHRSRCCSIDRLCLVIILLLCVCAISWHIGWKHIDMCRAFGDLSLFPSWWWVCILQADCSYDPHITVLKCKGAPSDWMADMIEWVTDWLDDWRTDCMYGGLTLWLPYCWPTELTDDSPHPTYWTTDMADWLSEWQAEWLAEWPIDQPTDWLYAWLSSMYV